MDRDLADISIIALRRIQGELSPRTSLSAAIAYIWVASQDRVPKESEIVEACGVSWGTAANLHKMAKEKAS